MKIFVRIIELYKFEFVEHIKFQSYGEIESTRLFEFDGENTNG